MADDDLRVRDGVAYTRLRPRQGGASIAEVELEDVRAADSVRLVYDFDRDGWIIQQASRFSWEVGEQVDSDWQEVAFVQAWARKVSAPWEDDHDG